MLRQAVIQELKSRVTGVEGRVFQAFLAGPNTKRPYITVKIPASRGSPQITYAGDQPVEVRVYDDQASFDSLDILERSVIDALHGKTLSHGGESYALGWVPGGGDFVDEERKLIGRLVMFEAAVLHEPGGA